MTPQPPLDGAVGRHRAPNPPSPAPDATPPNLSPQTTVEAPPAGTTLPPAWIIDIDGTLALGHFDEPGRRGPYDWHRVSEDDPNWPVIHMVRALGGRAGLVFLSGRDEVCRDVTLEWLWKVVHPRHSDGTRYAAADFNLLMRPAGDYRKDAIVKAEIFWEHIASRWHVLGVIDDRRQVVTMWRSLGLMCAQVAEGDF